MAEAEAGSLGPFHRVRVEWVTAAFGILVGITMVYVPYEFGTPLFQIIYPYIRLLGTCLLLGASTTLVALLYPTWPRWIGWLGRGVLLGALIVYWWAATLLSGGLTGTLVYPLMVGLMIAESLPRWRDYGLFPVLIVALALAFGTLMVVAPTHVGHIFYPALQPHVWLMGLVFLWAGGVLFLALLHQRRGPMRLAELVLGGQFGYMALLAGAGRAWAGLSLYTLLSLGCVLLLLLRRLPETTGLGWRLFRGVALASVLPVLGVGAMASVLAQAAIEHELRDKAQQAVAAEVAWLEQTATTARFALLVQTHDPALLKALREHDLDELRARIKLLETQPGPFDGAWLLDSRGAVIVSSMKLGNGQNNFAYRDYFRQAPADGGIYLSSPFLGISGVPLVTFSTTVELGDGTRGVLVGAVSLLRVGRQQTLASRNYHVEIFDQRAGTLLRETENNQVLTRAPVLSLVDLAEVSGASGMVDAFDALGQRLLVAHGQVSGTPWIVSLTAPLRQAFAVVTRLSALVVAIALLAGLVALVLSHWVGQEVAQRLTALRDGFTALGTLPLERPVPARGDDELTQLTAGFNEMAARIERTQKELREAISTRDQFLSMASHELRTPLTPLKATVDLLLRQALPGVGLSPERLRSTLERLRRQVDRLTRLIGDMLDVSRMQSGRFSLRPAPMDLSALAREVVDRIQYARSERTAPITLELPDAPLLGVWDEQRLDQLLTNLVENAVRYSPADTPIHVRLGSEARGVRLEVEDHGIGVPADSLPHLFTAFYRANNASAHHAGGLGLGLAICQEIVQRHGGHIHATSPGPGQGTCFHVLLPHTESPPQV